MTDAQREKIIGLRANGLGCKKIAQVMGLSENTVKSFCRRMVVEKPKTVKTDDSVCECCGQPIVQSPGRKKRRFCSDICRVKWWNRHTNLMKENLVCVHCGKPFHGRKGRKYCSHACYMAERFGGRHAS